MTSANKLLDPKNDVAFKRIFGTEKNKDILIHFLNDMLVFKNNAPIVDVTFLKPILDPEISSQKTSIVDVLCKDSMGSTYIVEMQVAKYKGFEKRAQFYASKAYSSQANVGDEYQNLKEVVFLAIVDYVMFPEKEAIKSDHVILDRETFEHDLTDFSFTFLELGKFKKSKDDIDRLNSITEKWCYFFKYAEEVTADELTKLIEDDKVIEKAYQELDRFYWTTGELMGYEEAVKIRRDNKAALDQKFDEGLERGLTAGEAKGRREVALNLLKLKAPDSMILQASGLTESELKTLKDSMSGQRFI